jgi:hypothetical protein
VRRESNQGAFSREIEGGVYGAGNLRLIRGLGFSTRMGAGNLGVKPLRLEGDGGWGRRGGGDLDDGNKITLIVAARACHNVSVNQN